MSTLSDLARDERSARLLLSLVGTPNDEGTGRLLARVGAEELIILADRDTAIPGMDRAEAAVWRDHIHAHRRVDQAASFMAESERYRFIIPSDADWPPSLNDLGSRSPYGLWVNGNTDLLRGDVSERVTITGARAATGYGTFVTNGKDAVAQGGLPATGSDMAFQSFAIVIAAMLTAGSALLAANRVVQRRR